MNIKEAYQLLEVPEDISDEELKKKFKKLAAKYHPDIYKDNPEKFKQINAAHQLITDYRANPAKYEQPNVGWSNMQDFFTNIDLGSLFNNFDGNFHSNSPEPVIANIKISFHEAVMGCHREISYKRNIKCHKCNGDAVKQIKNDCKQCDGFGRQTTKNRGMVFQSICSKCQGKGVKQEKCGTCDGNAIIEEKRDGSINVPPGTENGKVLRVANAGNFVGRSFMRDAYTDLYINVSVEAHPSMKMVDNDVCSDCTISLLEALKGSTKEVETVYGNKVIEIPPKIKNADKIYINKCGVKNTSGKHIVSIKINYPNDVSKLIELLSNE